MNLIHLISWVFWLYNFFKFSVNSIMPAVVKFYESFVTQIMKLWKQKFHEIAQLLFDIRTFKILVRGLSHIMSAPWGGRGQKFPKICWHCVLEMLTRGGSKTSKNVLTNYVKAPYCIFVNKPKNDIDRISSFEFIIMFSLVWIFEYASENTASVCCDDTKIMYKGRYFY